MEHEWLQTATTGFGLTTKRAWGGIHGNSVNISAGSACQPVRQFSAYWAEGRMGQLHLRFDSKHKSSSDQQRLLWHGTMSKWFSRMMSHISKYQIFSRGNRLVIPVWQILQIQLIQS